MSSIEIKINEHFQRGEVSCLAACALVCLNCIDPKRWAVNDANEALIIRNIQFDELHNFGCYPKLMDYLSQQGYRATYLLGSVPTEKDSEEKSLFDIWIDHYKKITLPDQNGTINFVGFEGVLKSIDEILFNKRVPVIFYSANRWHNLVIYGKRNESEYLIFDPISGRKVFNSTLLKKTMRTPWGVNALYIENGTKRN